jgi:hypothetical protein
MRLFSKLKLNMFVLFVLSAFFLVSCDKDFDAKPTYRPESLAGTWAKVEPFYKPKGFVYIPSSNSWRPFIGFSFTTETEPDVLGFANPYVFIGKGTNALDMLTFYAEYPEGSVSSNNYTYNVIIPKCFQFIPDAPGAKKGNVLVIPQKVKLTRTASFNFSTYEIPIRQSDEPGRYDLTTKEFNVEVEFDDTAVGGSLAVKRKYKFSQ